MRRVRSLDRHARPGAILEHERACDGTGTAAALKAGDKENRNGLKAGSL